jgi:hypothetical protein
MSALRRGATARNHRHILDTVRRKSPGIHDSSTFDSGDVLMQ